MIKAYFNTNKHSEWVATFDTEETYDVCWPHLEKLAEKHRMFLVDSVIEDKKEQFIRWLEECPVDWNRHTDNRYKYIDEDDEIQVIRFTIPKEDKDE